MLSREPELTEEDKKQRMSYANYKKQEEMKVCTFQTFVLHDAFKNASREQADLMYGN